MQREVLIVGVNHHSAEVAVREQLAFRNGALDEALRRLVTLPEIDEGAILTTCNRVEVVAATADGDHAVDTLTGFLAERERMQRDTLIEHLSVYRGREGIRHLFRVAASLDSMIVGEPQILGQLKELYDRAAKLGATGTILHRCFHRSFKVAKRVRTETGVATGAVSVSTAAVELAHKIFDRLEDKTAMLIGAGTMGALAARHLLSHGVRNLIVANRTFDRAVALARELHGTPVAFEHLNAYLHLADVVIGSTAAEQPVLTPALVQQVLRQRKYRPMFLIDMSVPRNFDPLINEIDNVYVYDIDDLGGVAATHREDRGREAERAALIIEEEVDGFCRWLASLAAVPTIVALREKVESIRKGELEKTLGALPELPPETRASVDAMTSAIVNKILHAPLTRLKDHDRRREAQYLDAARHLFGIEEPDEP